MNKKYIATGVTLALVAGLLTFFISYYFSPRVSIEREMYNLSLIERQVQNRSCSLGKKMSEYDIRGAEQYLSLCAISKPI